MFDDYLVRKQVVLEYKTLILSSGYIGFHHDFGHDFDPFTHDFGQKMEILSLYLLGQIGLEILFDDHWGRKQALLDYKILDITKLPCWDFFIGVNPRFWSKIANFLFVCLFALFFGKISLEIMSDDHLVKNQALFQSKVLAI